MSYVWFVLKQRAEFNRFFIESSDSSDKIRNKISDSFKLEKKLSFRLRNWRGNLVPINGNLAKNSKKTAYRIEIYLPLVRMSVQIETAPKLERMTTMLATKSVLNGFYQKLLRLETAYKCSQNKFEKNLNNRLDEIENRLDFIEKRFNDIDTIEWNGNFKRPLLWQSGSKINLVFLDASRAFDKLWRDGLFYKLLNNVPNPIWRILFKYYSLSKIKIKYEDQISDLINTSESVKQGGILSPHLFNFFMNDLLKECTALDLAYCDDILILSPSEGHCQILLKICEDFSKNWKIDFNTNKSAALTLHKAKNS
ncbi:unnamed protein product [Brachionus calyciflorus]|uniref:Reverse transcriptase domain-containing protein n=1 Tax=Brachionus calyciflorus TaxID=104777 RepID=A0A813S7U7_9BILA|nr:unnamed protein product [Brachionus calyciflorus]